MSSVNFNSGTVLIEQAQLANLQPEHITLDSISSLPRCNMSTNRPKYEVNLASYLRVLSLPSHLQEWSCRVSCNALFGQYCVPAYFGPGYEFMLRIPNRIESNLAQRKVDPASASVRFDPFVIRCPCIWILQCPMTPFAERLSRRFE